MSGAIFWLPRINLRLAHPLPAMARRLRLWRRQATSRAALGELPPDRLRDIGMTAMDAALEARRPFWDNRP